MHILLEHLDSFGWSQSVHITQVPLKLASTCNHEVSCHLLVFSCCCVCTGANACRVCCQAGNGTCMPFEFVTNFFSDDVPCVVSNGVNGVCINVSNIVCACV